MVFAMAKIWLITGSGNGLGRDIAEAALATGGWQLGSHVAAVAVGCRSIPDGFL